MDGLASLIFWISTVGFFMGGLVLHVLAGNSEEGKKYKKIGTYLVVLSFIIVILGSCLDILD